MNNIEEEYKYFILNCTSSPKSYRNYSDFGRISKTLQEIHNTDEYDIYKITSADELQSEINLLNENENFIAYNKKGSNQYSNALSMYLRFLKARTYFRNCKNNALIEKSSKSVPLQQIYYGAPGTGKSFTIDNFTDDENSVRTTFHPDTDYASFVGSYKPTMKDMPLSAFVGKEVHRAQPQGEHPGTEQRIVYKYVPQAFLKAYVSAWSKLDTPYYLIIEEINRGNCAQIFGDLFQLLDRNNSGCSSYAINADEDISKFLKEDKKGFASLSQEQHDAIAAYEFVKDNGERRTVGEKILDGTILLLPPNLHIWATMNTSDQSLFPIDSAFKRRWNWKYVPIDTNPIDKNTKQPLNWKFEVAGNLYSWGKFLEKINPEIYSITESSDKQMGYFFAKADPTTGIISEEVFLNKVLFYLWTDVFKDYDVSSEIFKNEKENRSFRFTDFFEDADALANFIDNCGLEILNDNSEDYNPGDTEESNDSTLYDEYQEYWGKVKDFINNKLGPNIASQTPLKQNWYNIHFGASCIVTFISRNTQTKHLRVGFSISKKAKHFDKFKIEEIKETIPSAIERTLDKNVVIEVAKTDVADFDSQECMDWIADNVKQFYELGKKLISSNK